MEAARAPTLRSRHYRAPPGVATLRVRKPRVSACPLEKVAKMVDPRPRIVEKRCEASMTIPTLWKSML